jgi:hypothetical protein
VGEVGNMRGEPGAFGRLSRVMAVALLIPAFSTALPESGVAWTSTASTAAVGGCSATGDFTTGGGWLLPGAKLKRTFALFAEFGLSPPLGRLLFVNHISKERVEGEIITYVITGNRRIMTGIGTANDEAATFKLEVSDVTEPGRQDDFDLLYVTETGVGREQGPLGGGNIQIHPMCDLT